MDVPRKFLIKSDALRKILMDRSLVDVDKLRIIQNGLNSGDFTNDLPSTSESSRITPQDRPKHLSQERPDNSIPLQHPYTHPQTQLSQDEMLLLLNILNLSMKIMIFL